MIGSLFHYLMRVHSVVYVYEEEKPVWNRVCSLVLNIFFMRRKLEYCELLSLRRKVAFYKWEAKRNAKRYANILDMYNAHIDALPESRCSQYNLEDINDAGIELPDNDFLSQPDSVFTDNARLVQ